MKKLIIILTIALISTGCSIYEEIPTQTIVETPAEEVKPLTKQVCDILGFMSSEIIEEQAQQGYTLLEEQEDYFVKIC